MPRQTIERYFTNLGANKGWEESLADDMTFTSFAVPNRHVEGKEPYLQATRRFFGMIHSVEVRQLLVDGNRVVALTRYLLQPPNGAAAFSSDVAEVFVVRSGRIASLDIYFDTAPYPR
jgi:ketosteroid isomerase-like protein